MYFEIEIYNRNNDKNYDFRSRSVDHYTYDSVLRKYLDNNKNKLYQMMDSSDIIIIKTTYEDLEMENIEYTKFDFGKKFIA